MCLETPGVASDRYIPHSFQIVPPSLPIKNQCTNKPRTTQLFLLVAATDPNAFGFSLIPKLFWSPVVTCSSWEGWISLDPFSPLTMSKSHHPLHHPNMTFSCGAD